MITCWNTSVYFFTSTFGLITEKAWTWRWIDNHYTLGLCDSFLKFTSTISLGMCSWFQEAGSWVSRGSWRCGFLKVGSVSGAAVPAGLSSPVFDDPHPQSQCARPRQSPNVLGVVQVGSVQLQTSYLPQSLSSTQPPVPPGPDIDVQWTTEVETDPTAVLVDVCSVCLCSLVVVRPT